MGNYYEIAMESASYIESKIPCRPEIAVILGSGLGVLADDMENTIEIDYRDIPNFPRTTVRSHEGRLVFGMLAGKHIMVFKGRFHYYEGYDIQNVVFPVRLLKLMKIKNLILTNAAGGINQSFVPGDLMLIRDHISLFAPSPLRGRNDEKLGERFPDMTLVYNKKLLEHARKCAVEYSIVLREGIYVYVPGPMYETPAEIRMLAALGGDAVGMSTVPEAIAAKHQNMRVLGISCITNMAAGIGGNILSHDEVVNVSQKVKNDFKLFLTGIIGGWSFT